MDIADTCFPRCDKIEWQYGIKVKYVNDMTHIQKITKDSMQDVFFFKFNMICVTNFCPKLDVVADVESGNTRSAVHCGMRGR